MHSSCPASCGRCDALRGPLVAVQALPGLGGTAARHIRLGAETGHRPRMGRRPRQRDLLLVANYKSREPGQGVAVYEWRAGKADDPGGVDREPSWHLIEHIDAPGAGEATLCRISQTGEELLVLPSWNANGSFATDTQVLAFDVEHTRRSYRRDGHFPLFVRRQALPTHGSHDAECFVSDHGGEETAVLVVANGRHDSGRRDVESVVYTYDVQAQRFVEVQRLQTVGAHDIELLHETSMGTLAVVANGASWRTTGTGPGAGLGEESCDDADVHVYRWDVKARRFALLQRLDPGGCTTFARAWRTGNGRTLLAVAVERLRSGSYDGGVRMFEWSEAPGT